MGWELLCRRGATAHSCAALRNVNRKGLAIANELEGDQPHVSRDETASDMGHPFA
jgi:hypothetical protein